MLISSDQTIAGRSAIEVREMMKALQREDLTVGSLARRFGLDDDECDVLFSRLHQDGFVEMSDGAGRTVVSSGGRVADTVALWRTTIQGSALAKARIGIPMSRAKAQSLVDGVLARAEEVNLDPAWLYWVLEVGVYGSFAVESVESVGDVDVAVRLERRHEHDEHYRHQDEMIERDQANPRSFLDLRNYARLKVLRHVRGRSWRVDLVEMDESDSLPPGAQLRVVYRYELPDS